MMVLEFIGPVLASVLYVVVFQKARFKGAILAFCATPILGVFAWIWANWIVYAHGPVEMFYYLSLIYVPFSLLPLLVLAFKSWPPVAAPKTPSEN